MQAPTGLRQRAQASLDGVTSQEYSLAFRQYQAVCICNQAHNPRLPPSYQQRSRFARLPGTPLDLLPALAYVTLITAHTELAVVQILRAMAAHAFTAQRCNRLALEGLLLVTRFAIELAMLSVQAVLGLLVMIELPQTPCARVVAILTKRAQLLLVLVLLLVAAQTITRRILVACALVTGLAGSGEVAPRERETCQSMVEFFNTP